MRVKLKPEEARKAFDAMPELERSAIPDGDFVLVAIRDVEASKPPRPTGGPGTELKRILASAGFQSAGCQCDARALEMDSRGIEWCRKNDAIIVGWLADAAKERGFPFSRAAGHLLVWAAIAAARRKTPLANPKTAE